MSSGFVWCLHQPAAARWVKRDIARLRPELRLAFSSPGLTTFKVPEANSEALPVRSALARAAGWSLGRARNLGEVLALADQVPATAPVRLHVFERDPARLPDERDPALLGTRPRALETLLRAAAPDRFLPDSEAQAG
ncbi:MAG TPA: hypothetical protein VGF45_14750, partial [Polyangia bacterium]